MSHRKYLLAIFIKMQVISTIESKRYSKLMVNKPPPLIKGIQTHLDNWRCALLWNQVLLDHRMGIFPFLAKPKLTEPNMRPTLWLNCLEN